MNNPKQPFDPSHGSRRERGSMGLSGGAQRAVPAEAALREKWNRGMIEARAGATEHNARGESQFAAWKLGYASALESVISDLDGTNNRAAGGNDELRHGGGGKL